jgi:hypothetical protein
MLRRVGKVMLQLVGHVMLLLVGHGNHQVGRFRVDHEPVSVDT